MLYRLTMKGEGAHISFDVRQHRAESPFFWRNYKVVTWDELNEESGPIMLVMKGCDIDCNKCTHFRQSAIDYAGTEGLAEEAIATMTKHSSKKLTKSYMPELKKDVLEVMAGFTGGEKYFVPRSLIFGAIACPWTIHDITATLFPDLPRWKAEIQSVHGDHNNGSVDFVNRVIPTMAKIIFQDGIYWVRDFPNHPISQFLTSKFPGYDRWAIVARAECDKRQNDIEKDTIKALNEAAAAAFHAVARKQDSMEALSKEQHDEVMARIDHWGSTNYQMLQDILRHVSHGQAAPAQPAQVTVQPIQAQAPPVPATITPRRIQPSATDILRRSGPRVPPITGTLPKSMGAVLLEHSRLNLEDYCNITGKERLWGRGIAQAYGKREYLVRQINARAQRDTTTKTVAAAQLDHERGNASLYQYYQRLRRVDPNIRRRPGGRGPRTRRAIRGIQRTHGRRVFSAARNQINPPAPTAAQQAQQDAANTFVEGVVGRGTADV
jgi:hypothetical protein